MDPPAGACFGPSEKTRPRTRETKGKRTRVVVVVVVVDRTKGKHVHLPRPFQEPTFEARMENTSTWLPFGSCVPTRSVVVMCRSRASSRLCSHNRLPHFPPPIPSDNPMEKNEVKAKFDMHAPHPTVSFLECNWVDVSRRFLPNVKTAHSRGGVFSTLAKERGPSRVHVDTT